MADEESNLNPAEKVTNVTLFQAIAESRLNKVTELVDQGADLEVRDDNKRTPLLYAIFLVKTNKINQDDYQSNCKIIEILIKAELKSGTRMPSCGQAPIEPSFLEIDPESLCSTLSTALSGSVKDPVKDMISNAHKSYAISRSRYMLTASISLTILSFMLMCCFTVFSLAHLSSYQSRVEYLSSHHAQNVVDHIMEWVVTAFICLSFYYMVTACRCKPDISASSTDPEAEALSAPQVPS